ncbi:hypothetical protein GE061_016578 [Apolygus lucorum]|uniref:Anaphase-promoting complex subunit CDC26 n=1 Tax=Apolygus lucorum TaxID=248454 RepID=A0A8S9XIP6_APOLU|nr:hypothetical protein GE061_016578 [Apolygus lucorum]
MASVSLRRFVFESKINQPTRHLVVSLRMIRRTPTRIELKLDDIAEYHNTRNSMSGDKDQESSPQNVPAWTYKLLLQNNKNLTVADRIGYVPQPRTPT